jgi:hypothetical protein
MPLGALVEVIDPPELRRMIIDIAASISRLYAQPG